VRLPLEHHLHGTVRSALAWSHGIFPQRYHGELRAFEALDPAAKRRRSLELLRRTLTHAYDCVAYYQRCFDEAGFHPRDLGGFEDLAAVPMLGKQDVIRETEALVATGREARGADWDATGGSTGEPMRFLRSRPATSVGLANEARTWRWYGVHPGARQAYLWGADRDVPPDRAADSWRARLLGICQLNAFYQDEERCAAFARILDRFQPEIVYGYASALARFAAYLRDTPRSPRIRPRAVRATAEVLRADDRALVEEVFGAPVYDYYGSRETGPIAGESAAHAGLHVFSDVTHVEIVRGDGTPCQPGEVGELVVTPLRERAMPLVRYRIGDRAAFLPDEPDDGLGLPRIGSLQGRIGDFVRSPGGREIHGEYFTHLFYGVSGVQRFQVQQTSPARLRILVQSDGRVAPAQLERIRAASAERFQATEPGAVTIELVDEIHPGPSGKHRFVLPYQDG